MGCLIATQLELYKYVRVQEVVTSQLEISSRSLLMEPSCFLQFLNPFVWQFEAQADLSVCEEIEKRLRVRIVPCGEQRSSGLTPATVES